MCFSRQDVAVHDVHTHHISPVGQSDLTQQQNSQGGNLTAIELTHVGAEV